MFPEDKLKFCQKSSFEKNKGETGHLVQKKRKSLGGQKFLADGLGK